MPEMPPTAFQPIPALNSAQSIYSRKPFPVVVLTSNQAQHRLVINIELDELVYRNLLGAINAQVALFAIIHLELL
jgi:hypothetical protein